MSGRDGLDDPEILASSLRSLAVGWGLYAGLTMLVGCSGLLFVAMGGLVATLPQESGEPAPVWVGVLFGTMGLMVTGIIWAASLPTLVGAWGLYRGRPWAKLLILMLAIWNFFQMPVGTALSLWTVYVLYRGGMDLDFSWMWRKPARDPGPPGSAPGSPP